MNRGDVWIARVGGKRRPVLVLTRDEVIDVRELVTVAEITTKLRGIAAEVVIDHETVGLDRESAVNCDGLHTMLRRSLDSRVGRLDDFTLRRVCTAVNYALGC
ncbi:MAG: type II toxin-antitoxin system PemK/MazF family toxin [Nocardioides sp.]